MPDVGPRESNNMAISLVAQSVKAHAAHTATCPVFPHSVISNETEIIISNARSSFHIRVSVFTSVILTFCEISHPLFIFFKLFEPCYQATLLLRRSSHQRHLLNLLIYLCLCLQQACSLQGDTSALPLFTSQPHHSKPFLASLTYFMISPLLLSGETCLFLFILSFSPVVLIDIFFNFREMFLQLCGIEQSTTVLSVNFSCDRSFGLHFFFYSAGRHITQYYWTVRPEI